MVALRDFVARVTRKQEREIALVVKGITVTFRERTEEKGVTLLEQRHKG